MKRYNEILKNISKLQQDRKEYYDNIQAINEGLDRLKHELKEAEQNDWSNYPHDPNRHVCRFGFGFIEACCTERAEGFDKMNQEAQTAIILVGILSSSIIISMVINYSDKFWNWIHGEKMDLIKWSTQNI